MSTEILVTLITLASRRGRHLLAYVKYGRAGAKISASAAEGGLLYRSVARTNITSMNFMTP